MIKTNEEAIDYINSIKNMFESMIKHPTHNNTVLGSKALEIHKKYIEACEWVVQAIGTVDKEYTGKWIPVKYRLLHTEGRIEFDCPMPKDGQEVLISSHWGVEKDTAHYEDGEYWLDCRDNWEGIDAWMPSPEQYKGDEK